VRVFFATCIVALLSPSARADPPTVGGDRFRFALPGGYAEITEQVRSQGFERPQLSIAARTSTRGFQPAIMFQRVPAYGGSLADPELCARAAARIAGEHTKVKSARIIRGPTGSTCQIQLVRDDRVAAVITELNGRSESWLMICNHADGDAVADKICRETWATVTPAPDFGVPDAAALPLQRLLDRVAYRAHELLAP
jgi:hypothetical protein